MLYFCRKSTKTLCVAKPYKQEDIAVHLKNPYIIINLKAFEKTRR